MLSAQKYLAAPTAGLIVGRADLVEACRAQDSGIGRAMKPTKEAVVGVLAALQERRSLDLDEWTANQHSKVAAFVKQAARIGGLRATTVPDSTGLPFSRVCLTVDPAGVEWSAAALARHLRAGAPPIWLMDHQARDGRLFLELVPLDEGEVREILRRLAALAATHGPPPV